MSGTPFSDDDVLTFAYTLFLFTHIDMKITSVTSILHLLNVSNDNTTLNCSLTKNFEKDSSSGENRSISKALVQRTSYLRVIKTDRLLRNDSFVVVNYVTRIKYLFNDMRKFVALIIAETRVSCK